MTGRADIAPNRESHLPISMTGMSDNLESLQHLLDIERKLATLEQAGLEAADQIAQQLIRERPSWCPCRILNAIRGLEPGHRRYIVGRLKFADLRHIEDLADPCACQDLWLSGHLPIDVSLPTRPGVYICFDERDRAAYIGTSRNNVKSRLQAHFRDPDKPRLARWAAFFPGQFGESAAIWEVRLIEEHKPYLNREHVHDDDPGVDWEPQGYQTQREPWYFRDPDYVWFLDGPGRLIDKSQSEHWQTAKAIRNALDGGATREDIEEACYIVADRPEVESPVGYMIATARNIAANRIEAGGP